MIAVQQIKFGLLKLDESGISNSITSKPDGENGP